MGSGALRACCVAAAVMVCRDLALAQGTDIEAPPASELSGGPKPEHFLFYSGFDVWRFGRTGFGGFYAAPEGLDNDGFVVRLFVSDGRERYDTGAKRFNTDVLRVSLLPGARLTEGTFELKVFAGAELENRVSSPGVTAANSSLGHMGV